MNYSSHHRVIIEKDAETAFSEMNKSINEERNALLAIPGWEGSRIVSLSHTLHHNPDGTTALSYVLLSERALDKWV